MNLLPLLALLAITIWVVDRFLLWCELRGWITYRRMPRVRHGFGNAVLNIDALLQPERRHVIELKQAVELHREDDDEAGGDGGRRISFSVDSDCDSGDPDRTVDDRRAERKDVSPPFRHE